jgi:hypothetical protein
MRVRAHFEIARELVDPQIALLLLRPMAAMQCFSKKASNGSAADAALAKAVTTMKSSREAKDQTKDARTVENAIG